MFGIRFIKAPPTTYLFQYKKGKSRREGKGLAFFYYAPTTTLVAVPLESADVPFIFNEVTSDFQQISIQGQVTYKIADPQKVSQLLNFTLDASGRTYTSEDPHKLPQRLVNIIQVLMRTQLSELSLRDALKASDGLVARVGSALNVSIQVSDLGLHVLGLSILAIKPTPDTSRALEAEVREQLLRQADEAVYTRRNAAVEQERAIKENELNTEIAVENKKRQIREAQMDAEKSVQERLQEMKRVEMQASILLEEKNKELVAITAENSRSQADARAYAIGAVLKTFAGMDPKVLQAITAFGMQPDQMIAWAFRELAEGAEKIGELNISPDLLRELMKKGK